jgi:hypothetical protein
VAGAQPVKDRDRGFRRRGVARGESWQLQRQLGPALLDPGLQGKRIAPAADCRALLDELQQAINRSHLHQSHGRQSLATRVA